MVGVERDRSHPHLGWPERGVHEAAMVCDPLNMEEPAPACVLVRCVMLAGYRRVAGDKGLKKMLRPISSRGVSS